jgi:hypothetical protein
VQRWSVCSDCTASGITNAAPEAPMTFIFD